MGTVVLFKKPVFIDLDRRRRVVFNLNTEINIRQAGGRDLALWETIGETQDPATGKVSRTLDVNIESLRLYLWAALQEDADRRDEHLSLTDVGALLTRRAWVTKAVVAITEALQQYYGDDPNGDTKGEAPAPAASA